MIGVGSVVGSVAERRMYREWWARAGRVCRDECVYVVGNVVEGRTRASVSRFLLGDVKIEEEVALRRTL